TPLGGLPILEINGKTFVQGLALASFLARENGLHGSNNLESMMIDQIVLSKEDVLVAEVKAKFEKDEAKKAEVMKDLTTNVYPKFFGFFIKAIKENPAKSGFVVGKKVGRPTLNMNVSSKCL
ncbi:glutathione S-transferase 2, partial [Aplysia californica]|uniref:Glutathione S-transferase 2 n=1 Tax=Aplysia californica TaxID=6500 RepID=A0ABM1AFK7_APLCA